MTLEQQQRPLDVGQPRRGLGARLGAGQRSLARAGNRPIAAEAPIVLDDSKGKHGLTALWHGGSVVSKIG